jgi:KUP system potassium uptake protein
MARALSEASVSNSDAHTGRGARRDFWALTLGSIGVVYGDIGTSPLYAVRESVLAAGGVSEGASAEIILGILSLIIWALILVVTVKWEVWRLEPKARLVSHATSSSKASSVPGSKHTSRRTMR